MCRPASTPCRRLAACLHSTLPWKRARENFLDLVNEHGSRPTLGKNNHFSFRASASFARPIKCRTKNFSYTFYTNNFPATERTSSGRRGNFLENSFRVSIIQREISNGACSERICGQRENSGVNGGSSSSDRWQSKC